MYSSCRNFRRLRHPARSDPFACRGAGQDPHRVRRRLDEERARRHRRRLYREDRRQDHRRAMPQARRWPSRSNRARRPTCSSPPTPTGWTTRSAKKTINEPTRVNLLGNSIVLIAPKDSKIDNVEYRRRLRSRQARRRRQDRDRRRESGAGRQIRQGGAGEARRVAGRRAEIRDGRKRARRADAGGARRSRARHRLFDRRQGRARRQDRRHLPGRFASGDHLSRRGDHDREAGDERTISPSCARRRQRPSSKNTASSSWSARLPPDVRDLARRMDGDPAVAAGRHRRNAGGDAVRHRAGVAAGAA